jgi:Flp pilus assembly protein TadG
MRLRRPRRLWPRSAGRDRGASVVELAVLAPGFLMVIMLIIQFALWFNARQAALSAAQAGAQVARENASVNPGGWQAMAQQASTRYYTELNSHLLSSLTATASGSPANNVSVTVSGPMGFSVFNFFGIKWTITETAGGPVECFRPVNGGGAC